MVIELYYLFVHMDMNITINDNCIGKGTDD